MDPIWEVTLTVQLSHIAWVARPEGQVPDVGAVQKNEFRGRGATPIAAYEQALEGVKGMSALLHPPSAPPES
jgi:hypothetical protein